ncbi:(2Fe-2S)-binding protein [Streptomyces dangxiongensis]|uniref:(2Fe-2S)-binding protein n=1 Tax=Streptomyces dangxiongensis TaxID=1442032 RepID=A0A3G2JPJ5_9ACTN|nr:(2Fe-2S)-binding protein [Streptomyces dangxiongensis]AYN43465.1 (2Fe-2S)-binding protein [Streptomyces dangxiongensis]
MDLDPDLAALRSLGGFFVLRTLPPSSPAAGGTGPHRFPTLAEAYEGAASDVRGDALALRVATVGARLRTAEPRVAASLAQQGLAARLWSAALGCAVLYGRLPGLDPRLLRWDALASAPDDLWLTGVRSLPGDGAAVAAAVLDAHLEPLGAVLRARYGVAAGLLRGNAGSALAATARELGRWARAHDRTDVVERASALTDELFAHPLLRATGDRAGPAFRRRSCCLYYRVPGGGLCGDCCLTRLPRSSPRAASG